jgi:hypothetical protein
MTLSPAPEIPLEQSRVLRRCQPGNKSLCAAKIMVILGSFLEQTVIH